MFRNMHQFNDTRSWKTLREDHQLLKCSASKYTIMIIVLTYSDIGSGNTLVRNVELYHGRIRWRMKNAENAQKCRIATQMCKKRISLKKQELASQRVVENMIGLLKRFKISNWRSVAFRLWRCVITKIFTNRKCDSCKNLHYQSRKLITC
jgi:hypothetical protein